MIHERFDLDRWTALFPLETARRIGWSALQRMRRHGGPMYHAVTEDEKDQYMREHHDWYSLIELGGPRILGPAALAFIEQLRAERGFGAACRSRVPADVFVFALGEPTRRDVTKVGGLPYWPADRPWPTSPRGAPLTFVAQFCFADSRDITGDLPGDVLLIFGELGYLTGWQGLHGAQEIVSRSELDEMGIDSRFVTDWQACSPESRLYFEWLTLHDHTLILPMDVPVTDWPIAPCYGQIHRTFDYELGDENRDDTSYSILEATKIGGLPFVAQEDPRGYLPGRFLATLEDTSARQGIPYPFVNVRGPLRDEPSPAYPPLTLGDSGRILLMIEDGGRLHYDVDSC